MLAPSRGLVLLLVMLLPLTAAAHEKREAVTRVLFNPRTGNIEVMHRVLLHDAEHAARRVIDAQADIIGVERSRQRFADYIRDGFALVDRQHGKSLQLQTVGHEIEGRHLWIYSETPIPDQLGALAVRHGALRELWSDQVNLVNVERNGELTTLLFHGAIDELVVPEPELTNPR